jgi:hypothetical protein
MMVTTCLLPRVMNLDNLILSLSSSAHLGGPPTQPSVQNHAHTAESKNPLRQQPQSLDPGSSTPSSVSCALPIGAAALRAKGVQTRGGGGCSALRLEIAPGALTRELGELLGGGRGLELAPHSAVGVRRAASAFAEHVMRGQGRRGGFWRQTFLLIFWAQTKSKLPKMTGPELSPRPASGTEEFFYFRIRSHHKESGRFRDTPIEIVSEAGEAQPQTTRAGETAAVHSSPWHSEGMDLQTAVHVGERRRLSGGLHPEEKESTPGLQRARRRGASGP